MKVKISNIKPNPNNPRTIKDERFAKLVKSLQDFPEMLDKRPLVCFTDDDGKFVVLGGNQRLKAAKEAGMKELPVLLADDWSEEQQREFIVRDNINFGQFDWEMLETEWETDTLIEWGLEMPEGKPFSDTDYSGKNKEIDVDEFADEMTITLKYTEAEYWQVKEGLSKIANTSEQAVWKLLGYE